VPAGDEVTAGAALAVPGDARPGDPEAAGAGAVRTVLTALVMLAAGAADELAGELHAVK
jgi:hypothetical protein